MPKTKWSALLSLVLVFLSGAMVGAFAHRLYMVNSVIGVAQGPARHPDPEEVRRQRINEIRTTVKLDDQQLKQIEEIYNETREQFDQIDQKRRQEFRAINDAQHAKVRAVLRPDQLPLYESMLAKHEAERKKRMEQMKQQGAPSKP